MILLLAVLVEHRLVTDRQTDTRRQLIPALASVALVKTFGGPEDTRTAYISVEHYRRVDLDATDFRFNRVPCQFVEHYHE